MANVWIVDDSALDAQRARQALVQRCQVEVFSDGSAALERLSNGSRPDAMVLDQVMPGVTGLELVRFMRSEKLRMPQVPVLLLTVRGARDEIVAGLEAGANDYLPKPFAGEELRARVDALLRSSELLARALSAENTLTDVLEAMPDAVLALDDGGNVTFANAEAARVFHLTLPGIVGRHLSSLLPSLTLPQGMVVGPVPLPDVRIGDRVFSPSIGGSRQTTVVLRDVTTRRQLDERRLDFYSIIAHDLRSPLTAMMLRTKRVMSGRLGAIDPRVGEELGKLNESMKSMADIITDFLDIARLEGSPSRLERAPLDLREVVETVVEELRPIGESAGLSLELQRPAANTELKGDRARLRQVVANLVGNAVKFTPRGGRVTVIIEDDGQGLRTSVVDTGPGVPAKSVPGLFDRFTRAPEAATKSGTGLGLMIVRQIVEAHGGHVGVDTSPGRGSTFWFTLPR